MVKGKLASHRGGVFGRVNTALCLIFLIIFAFPLYNFVISSFSSSSAVYAGRVLLWPVDVTLDGYREVFSNPEIWRGYFNSLVYAVIGVCLSLIMTTSVAYALSRKEFMLRGFIMKMMTLTMYFSGGLIPTYLLIRDLHMLYTLWPVILLGSVSVMNVIIMRTSFQTGIPEELRESALLDGCGDTRYLIRIVIPLSKAVIAVMVLYYGIACWNSYFNAMIYLKDRSMYPLQLILRDILFNAQLDMTELDDELMMTRLRMQESIKYCVIVVASVPPMIAYPMAQKYFIKGVMIGSIKG